MMPRFRAGADMIGVIVGLFQGAPWQPVFSVALPTHGEPARPALKSGHRHESLTECPAFLGLGRIAS